MAVVDARKSPTGYAIDFTDVRVGIVAICSVINDENSTNDFGLAGR